MSRASKLKHAAAALGALLVANYLKNVILDRRAARAARRRAALCKDQGFKVCIVGAGMSGICMAVNLQRAGIPFVILEAGSDYGGTWIKNSYPSSGCDVPSHWYCYSFEHNYDWTRVWAKQPEILAYYKHVAAKYGLRAHTRFNVSVSGAELDRTNGRDCWTVEFTENGEQKSETFAAFITAIGQLDKVSIPPFDGIENFKGKSFHTAEWDHSVQVEGKNVVGVGNGPSAIQAYPDIATRVNKLTVVQRSPVWCMPKDDYAYSRVARWVFQNVPYLMWIKRLSLAFQHDLIYCALIPSMMTNNLNWLIREGIKQQMKTDLGPEKWEQIRDKITPDYPLGCKRTALSSDWVPMLGRDNVDLQTSGVKKVHEDSVEFANGDRAPCDVLVYATGFKTSTFLSHFNIRTKDGLDLQKHWADVPRAYKTVAVPGFANFFMLYGPGANLGHSSIIHQTERQSEYITELLKYTVDAGISTLQVKKEKYDEYFDQLQKDLKQTVFDSDACDSWYKTSTGVVVNNWSSTTFRFYLQLSDTDIASYEQGDQISFPRKRANSNL